MRRSWAYVLMIVATLAGGSALLWPLPPTVQIEEVSAGGAAKPPPPPRAESPTPRNKNAAKAAAAAATKPEPPGVVKRFPTQNTSLERLKPPPRPGADAPHTLIPPPPGSSLPPRPPAEHKK